MNNIKLLYIDLFCGAGGTSTGVAKARLYGKKCAKVVACVNHDANAIKSHQANHPNTLHFTEDIRTLELSPMVKHLSKMQKKYPEAKKVLWPSLECTNFSKAKGGQPRDADSRTLAEHLFRYIEAIRPDFISIENVEEFMSWGDLDEKGQKDDTLQYFTNVIDRQQLYDNVKEVIKDVPAKKLYIDKAEFVVPMGMTTLEGFSEVIENILPAIWKEPCPFKGQEDMFLDHTMVAVMTITGSRSGLVCCRIRRIYRY